MISAASQPRLPLTRLDKISQAKATVMGNSLISISMDTWSPQWLSMSVCGYAYNLLNAEAYRHMHMDSLSFVSHTLINGHHASQYLCVDMHTAFIVTSCSSPKHTGWLPAHRLTQTTLLLVLASP